MIDNGHQYHWLTAYSRGRMSGHQLDWNRQPAFFKDYHALPSINLPRPQSLPQDSLFTLTQKEHSPSPPTGHNLNLNDISQLLLLTSAPTAKSSFEQGEIWYRSNPSAGALHPLEFYLSFPGNGDLQGGLYHYDLLQPALNRLSADPAAAAPMLMITALFFRSAWKYRERAYRYLLLDCGHALENMALALKSLRTGFEVCLDFSDLDINQLLKIDTGREICLAALRLRPPEAGSLRLDAGEFSGSETEIISGIPAADHFIDYPLLKEIHQATSVSLSESSVELEPCADLYQNLSNWHDIPENPVIPPDSLTYVESLGRRRSRRNFTAAAPLKLAQLNLLLDLLVSDNQDGAGPQPEILFLAAGVEGLADGLYLLGCKRRRYALFNRDVSSAALAAAALNQRWVANAALNFIFMADLEQTEAKSGPRSYRYLNINAGRSGQRLYLGATALNLGCCAVGAFYDRELAKTCALPENYNPLYLVAVGPVAGK